MTADQELLDQLIEAFKHNLTDNNSRPFILRSQETNMDDINVGDRRRWKGSDPVSSAGVGEFTMTEVAPWAVEYKYDDGSVAVMRRSEFERRTVPVPAAPTFERGDVVLSYGQLLVVTGNDDKYIKLVDSDGDSERALPHHLTPTGHKVATIDEGSWYVLSDKGGMILFPSRYAAEDCVEGRRESIATVRDGRIVEPYVDDDGVEHLVACNSEPRT